MKEHEIAYKNVVLIHNGIDVDTFQVNKISCGRESMQREIYFSSFLQGIMIEIPNMIFLESPTSYPRDANCEMTLSLPAYDAAPSLQGIALPP